MVGRAVPDSAVPMVPLPRQNVAGIRRALQARPKKCNEPPREALERVRIGGPFLTKARPGYSPFVPPDLNLMLAKELMEDTPGFKAYVWDVSVRDFVERTECAAEEAPDEESSMGAKASASRKGIAEGGI